MTDKGPKNTVESRLKAFVKSGLTGFGVWAPLLMNRVTGALFVDIQSPTESPSDGNFNSTGVITSSQNSLFNGSTWDRQRGNTEETFLASAARTATTNSADFTNFNAKGLHAIIDVSAVTATGSITPIIQGKDPVSGNYYDILQGLPITTVGTNVIKVYPGISAVVNASASDLLPRSYRLRVTHLNAVSMTYSVSGVLVI